MTPHSISTARMANATFDQLMTNPRSRVIATNLEQTTMTSGISHLSLLHADARRLDMLAEAAAERRVNEALDSRPIRTHSTLVELRHTIGTALVSFGHRLQHQPAPADPCAPLGSLRPAR